VNRQRYGRASLAIPAWPPDHHPLHRPLPDCLVLTWLVANVPVHAVIALDPDRDRILMVTVYQPSEEEWEDDWKTRK
jgi:hypothetical protein